MVRCYRVVFAVVWACVFVFLFSLALNSHTHSLMIIIIINTLNSLLLANKTQPMNKQTFKCKFISKIHLKSNLSHFTIFFIFSLNVTKACHIYCFNFVKLPEYLVNDQSIKYCFNYFV